LIDETDICLLLWEEIVQLGSGHPQQFENQLQTIVNPHSFAHFTNKMMRTRSRVFIQPRIDSITYNRCRGFLGFLAGQRLMDKIAKLEEWRVEQVLLFRPPV
jgi:hypothetical protein